MMNASVVLTPFLMHDVSTLFFLNSLRMNFPKESSPTATIAQWQRLRTGSYFYWKDSKWLTYYVGRALRRLGVKDSRKITRAGGRHFYTLRGAKILNLAVKAGIPLPEEQNGPLSALLQKTEDFALAALITPYLTMSWLLNRQYSIKC